MTTLDQIIDSAATGDLSTTLRSLLVVARRLHAPELTEWIRAELDGYDSEAPLPAYRGPFPVTVQGTYSGPVGMTATGPVSIVGVPPEYGWLFEMKLPQSVPTLEAYASSEDQLRSPWDPHHVALFNKWIDEGKVAHVPLAGLFEAHRALPPGLVPSVLGTIRTKALDLALDLQESLPDAGQKDGPTSADPTVASTITQITNNIYGPVGSVAQGSGIEQTATVNVGDVEALKSAAALVLEAEPLREYVDLLTSDQPKDEKRSSLSRFAERVRSGTVRLVADVARSVAAEKLHELGMSFLG